MDSFTLQHGNVALRYERQSGAISIVGTPWSVDLGETAEVEVRAVGVASATRYRIPWEGMTRRQLGPTRLQWLGRIGGAECALEVEIAEEGIRFTITDLGSGEADIVSAVWPGTVSLRGETREVCWSNFQQGLLFRADGKPWQREENLAHTSMRVAGLSSSTESLAIIAETQADAQWRLADDGQQTMSARVEFLPSLRSLAYARKVLLVPLPRPGYVEIARAFRDYAQRHGLWLSWEARVAQNPLVDRLRGAFVACAGYWHDEGADQLGVMRKMREYGFTRGYLFSPKILMQGDAWMTWLGVEANRMSKAQLDEIQALGYLAAPFLQVEEIDESFEGGRYFAQTAEGEKVKRWQIGETNFYEIVKWHVPATLPRFDEQLENCYGIHFDTLTAMRLVEHYGTRSYDRRGDAELRLKIAGYYREHGKVIAAESFHDWSVGSVDLATSKSFTPADPRDPRMWTVPLSDLVYHDSCIRTNWEHHPYDDNRCVHSLFDLRYHSFAPHLMNLLTCSPPVLFPEGKLYQFGHREVKGPDGETEWEVVWDQATPYSKRFTDPETQAALPKALEACRLHARHGVAQMVAHGFLGDGPCVQQSEFASGLRVTVNFGEEEYALPEGRRVKARSALVEE